MRHPTLLLAIVGLWGLVAHAVPKQIHNTTAERVKPLTPFYVPNGTVNLARGKRVTSSDDAPIFGTPGLITDGDKKANEGSWVEFGPGVQWVQIDLQQPSRVFGIHIWHYFGESRVYRDVVVRLADDADCIKNARTIYNNDRNNSSGLGAGTDKEFYEWNQGFRIDTRGKNYEGQIARYVRLYSNGNTSDPQNQYIEVEVIGKPLIETPQKPKSTWERVGSGELKGWQFTDLPAPYQTRYRRSSRRPPEAALTLPTPLLVPAEAAEVAAYKRVTSGVPKPASGSLERITQRAGWFDYMTDPLWVMLPPGLQWVQIDLQRPHYLYAVRLWHFFEDGRIYHDVIVQVADDDRFTRNVRTLFNNDADNSAHLGKGADGEYAESAIGLLLDTRGKDLRGVTARFVRFYSRGNSVNAFNHYVSIEIIGSKAPIRPPGRPDLMLWETEIPPAFYASFFS